jgi:hypothetical protein
MQQASVAFDPLCLLGYIESMDNDSIQSKGGTARAEALSAEERANIARTAATARWQIQRHIPEATHSGTLSIGGANIQCAVLADGRRVLTQQAVLDAIGRSRPSGAEAQKASIENLPVFLAHPNLIPFISEDLRRSSLPVLFRPLGTGGRRTEAGGKGGRGYALGYQAQLLPEICKVFMDANDARVLTASQKRIATRCSILLRGMATVGIIALVDEATGYQYVRDRLALQEILDQYIGKELAKWAKRFPDDFYRQIFRLKGWTYNSGSSKRPMQMARITCDLVFDRIGPGLTNELRERRQEILEATGKTGKLHQVMTPDVGHPALQHHISGIEFLAKAFPDGAYDSFHDAMDRVAPRNNRTLPLPFPDASISPRQRA